MVEHETAPLAHGQVGYLQIPAVDVWRSAEFYRAVFGWHVERPYPSFEAPGLIGQWIDDRPPAPDAGPLVWINVDDLGHALELATDNGGEITQPPTVDDGVRLLATIHDPAGNAIGVFQLDPGHHADA
ncbi:VOC family protein [Actinophytocola sp.]|jgi:predicted enzyme related to lactoylglutathione lyase|uniref:VOC family protein n=1 Tax=Actinophytocola sp. TaxID=1872138 RepID=UPI002ED99B84